MSLRSEKLHTLQEVLGELMINLKHTVDTRWLAMYDAIAAVNRSYSALVNVLTDEQASNQFACKGRYVLLCITQYNFPASIARLCDVLRIITNLSKKFQSDNMTSLQSSRQLASRFLRSDPWTNTQGLACVNSLRIFCLKPTVSSTEAAGDDEQDSFISKRSTYITSVTDALSDRLINDLTDALDLCSIIEPQTDCSADTWTPLT